MICNCIVVLYCVVSVILGGRAGWTLMEAAVGEVKGSVLLA